MARKTNQPKKLTLPLGVMPPHANRWVLASGGLEFNLWLRKSKLTAADRKKFNL